MRKQASAHELEHVASRECRFVCGINGCEYTSTGRMDAWLAARDRHRALEHPGFRERRRRRHSIRGLNKKLEYLPDEKETVAA